MSRNILIILAIVASAAAVSVPFTDCPGVSRSACKISEVDIDPCTVAYGPCRLKKGNDAKIVFKFTPNFSTTNLTIGVYWENSLANLRFLDLDSDGCGYTTCPTVSGTEQTYQYQLNISKTLPQGTFPTKWRIVGLNTENPKEVCCFLTKISLRN